MTKLLESVIIDCYMESIDSSDYQFAYKLGHSTNTYTDIFDFRLVVDSYIMLFLYIMVTLSLLAF